MNNQVKIIISAQTPAISGINKVKRQIELLAASYLSLRGGTEVFKRGIKAVDDYKTSVASLSAMVLSMMKKHEDMELASQYKKAHEYATRLYQVTEQLASQTMLSGQQANIMVQEFIKGGVAIDTANQRQIQSLKSIANALYTVTGGYNVELQAVTEINHLLQGNITAQDRLGKALLAMDPHLKEHLEIWRAEGTVLEHIGELLKGFDFATGELSASWGAVKSTLETTVDQVLREGMKPVYEDLLSMMQEINNYLQTHKKELQTDILKGYKTLKNTISGIYDKVVALKGIYDEIGPDVVGAAGYGLIGRMLLGGQAGKIIAMLVLLNTELKKFYGISISPKDMLEQSKEINKAIKNIYEVITGERDWQTGKVKLGVELEPTIMHKQPDYWTQFYQRRFDEWYNEHKSKLEQWKPEFSQKTMSDEETKQIQKKFDDWYKARQWLTDRINKLTLSEFDYQRTKLLEEYEERAKILGWTEDLYEAFQKDLERIDMQEAQKKLDARQWLTDKLNQLTLSEFDYRKTKLLEEYEKVAEVLGWTEDLYQAFKADLAKIQEEETQKETEEIQKRFDVWYEKHKAQLELMEKQSKGYFGNFKDGISDVVKGWGDAFDQMKEIGRDTAQAMQRAFSDFFFDVMTGKLRDLESVFKNFLNSILRSISDMMAEQVTKGLSGFIGSAISSLFGGGGTVHGINLYENFGAGAYAHSGGLVTSAGIIPKFHFGGLAYDEVPAILQRGEYVVSRRGVEALDRINRGQAGVNVVVNVENQTGLPLNAEQKGVEFDGEKYVVGVILKNYHQYGELYHLIGRRK